MTQGDIDQLLTPEERGFLLVVSRMVLNDQVLGTLTEDARERCEKAYGSLVGLPFDDREAKLSSWQMEAAMAFPPGLEQLHPSWILAAIRKVPPMFIRSFLKELPPAFQSQMEAFLELEESSTTANAVEIDLDPTRRRELLRFLLNPLEILTIKPSGTLGSELHALSADSFLLRIMHSGAVAIGYSLAGAPLAVRAKAMAALGKPWAALVGEKSSESVAAAEHALALSHTRTPIPPSVTGIDDRLLYIGLSVLKEPLLKEGENSLFSVAGRLPHSIGCSWLGALWRGWS